MKGSIRVLAGVLLVFVGIGSAETNFLLGLGIGIVGAAIMYSGAMAVAKAYEQEHGL